MRGCVSDAMDLISNGVIDVAPVGTLLFHSAVQEALSLFADLVEGALKAVLVVKEWCAPKL